MTTEANELMARIPHPRMPAILHARDYDRWLDREETERLPLDLLRVASIISWRYVSVIFGAIVVGALRD